MIKAIILGQLRHYTAIAGTVLVTWLVAHGAKADDANVLAAALPILISCAGSIYDKYHVSKTTTPNAGNS